MRCWAAYPGNSSDNLRRSFEVNVTKSIQKLILKLQKYDLIEKHVSGFLLENEFWGIKKSPQN